MKYKVIPMLVAALFFSVAAYACPCFGPRHAKKAEIYPQHVVEEFAECLTHNDVIMMGSDGCPHCRDQKKIFGTAFRNVNYVNCDTDEEKVNCVSASVKAYPTWFFGLKRYEGVKSLESLSNLSGCDILPDPTIDGLASSDLYPDPTIDGVDAVETR
ncbi:MAG: hypothetical protein ABIA21_01610 [Candidatus Aenigmatarchaeota archaeon]